MRNLIKIIIGVIMLGIVMGVYYFYPRESETALGSSASLWNRLYTTGFEWQSVTAGMEWETTTGSPAIDTTTKNSGAASMRSNPTASTAFMAHNFRADAVADAYLRTYVYIASAPAADASIIQYCDSSDFCGSKIMLTSGRQLKCNNSDNSLTTTGSATLGLNTWYRIEMYYNETANQCTVKIDGSTDISAAAVDDVGGGGRIRVGNMITATDDIYFDDIAVNSGAYAGEGKIVALLPVGAGSSACTAGDYTAINEVPPSDTAGTGAGNTCELDANPTTGFFAMTDSSTAGIDSYDTISLVAVMARIREEAAGTSNYFTTLKSAAGGTASSSNSVDAGNATARTNPTAAVAFTNIKYVYLDPTTGVDWIPTGTNSIDSMQAGAGTTDGAPDTWMNTLMVLVEYVDGTAPPAGDVVNRQSEIWFN